MRRHISFCLLTIIISATGGNAAIEWINRAMHCLKGIFAFYSL